MRSPIHTARGERTEKRDPYIFSMCYRLETQRRIYITVITTIRHMEKAYTTRAHAVRAYIRESSRVRGYIQIHRPASLYSAIVRRGVRAKITAGKLGICLRYTGLDICQEEEPGFLPPSVNLSGTWIRDASVGNGRNFGNPWRELLSRWKGSSWFERVIW